MYNIRRITWRTGASAKIPADVCFEELERIRKENGGDLTAELIVEAARPRAAVLHPQVFDLPQKAAAEEYYKQRARKTMGDLVTVYVDDTSAVPDRLEVRVFSTVEQRAGKGGRMAEVYSSTEESLQDPARREYILAEAIQQVAAWRKKYAALSELAVIFHAIDEIAV